MEKKEIYISILQKRNTEVSLVSGQNWLHEERKEGRIFQV